MPRCDGAYSIRYAASEIVAPSRDHNRHSAASRSGSEPLDVRRSSATLSAAAPTAAIVGITDAALIQSPSPPQIADRIAAARASGPSLTPGKNIAPSTQPKLAAVSSP